MVKKILVTGASGFVGRNACIYLRNLGYEIIALSRAGTNIPDVQNVKVSDYTTDIGELLRSTDFVVHAAARVHVMDETSDDPLGEFMLANCALTQDLASQSINHGVERFIFLSTIKVCGEINSVGASFDELTPAKPNDPYSISKHKAEEVLRRICDRSNMELVIIRPPLVYGSGVGANFKNLVRFVESGIPMPFGSIDNQRSIISLDNLTDLISVCIEHDDAAGRTFFASDKSPVSTTELIQLVAAAKGLQPRLVSVSPKILRWAFNAIFRNDLSRRLLDSLCCDIRYTCETLNWKPPMDTSTSIMQIFSKD